MIDGIVFWLGLMALNWLTLGPVLWLMYRREKKAEASRAQRTD